MGVLNCDCDLLTINRAALECVCVCVCITGAGPDVGHECVTFAAAAFVTSLRVRTVSIAASVHDGALVDV